MRCLSLSRPSVHPLCHAMPIPFSHSPSPLAFSRRDEMGSLTTRPSRRPLHFTRCCAPGTFLGWHAVVNRFTSAFFSSPFPRAPYPVLSSHPACLLVAVELAGLPPVCTSPPSHLLPPFLLPILPACRGLSLTSLRDAMPAAAARCARKQAEVQEGPTEGKVLLLVSRSRDWVLVLGVSQTGHAASRGRASCVPNEPTFSGVAPIPAGPRSRAPSAPDWPNRGRLMEPFGAGGRAPCLGLFVGRSQRGHFAWPASHPPFPLLTRVLLRGPRTAYVHTSVHTW